MSNCIVAQSGGPTSVINATVASSVNPGDVDESGVINITDVTLLINAVLNDNYSNINVANSDMNGDGLINITDVTQLITLVLSF